MAARAAKRPKPAAAPGRSMIWLQGLVCGAMVALIPPTALLLGALNAPALAAMVLDTAPGRPVARSMLLCSLAASVLPTVSLWHGGQSMGAAIGFITDPAVLGVAWLAAGIGWLVCQLAPMVVRFALDARGVARSIRLRASRARYVEAWGDEPTTPVEPAKAAPPKK